MTLIYYKFKAVLQARTKPGQIVSAKQLKTWFQQSHPGQPLYPARFSRKQGETQPQNTGKPRLPPLLNEDVSDEEVRKETGKTVGAKENYYRVLDNAHTVAIPEPTHYEILREALRGERGKSLTSQEIQSSLQDYYHQHFPESKVPVSFKNLHLYTSSAYKDGNHLLEQAGRKGLYRVCTPAREFIEFYQPHLAIHDFNLGTELDRQGPDKFQNDLLDLWQKQIKPEPDFHNWLAIAKRKLWDQNDVPAWKKELLETLLGENIEVSLLNLLELLVASDDLNDFYKRLKKHLSGMTLLADVPEDNLSYALQSLAWGIDRRRRSDAKLVEILASSPELESWQGCLELYYERLHHKRRPREIVLNEKLPLVLQQKGIKAIKAKPFLENVLDWFLVVYSSGKADLDSDWYRKGHAERLVRIQNAKWTDRDDWENALSQIWQHKSSLDSQETYVSGLQAALRAVYAIPGFENHKANPKKKQKGDLYPGIYLATGLLSLLFPDRIFTVSNHSIKGLKSIISDKKRVLPAFRGLEYSWIDFPERTPDEQKICLLLKHICFSTVPDLNQHMDTNWFNCRRLDQLIYTLRKYTNRDLKAILEDPSRKKTRDEDSLIDVNLQKLFYLNSSDIG